mmetsp:Transcript_5316/g.15763  ORF Transcript_5316/g.15763 Transcript_5316/m.15763 type:complete len:217 (-) Transcript_5316:2212-2862(-)
MGAAERHRANQRAAPRPRRRSRVRHNLLPDGRFRGGPPRVPREDAQQLPPPLLLHALLPAGTAAVAEVGRAGKGLLHMPLRLRPRGQGRQHHLAPRTPPGHSPLSPGGLPVQVPRAHGLQPAHAAAARGGLVESQQRPAVLHRSPAHGTRGCQRHRARELHHQLHHQVHGHAKGQRTPLQDSDANCRRPRHRTGRHRELQRRHVHGKQRLVYPSAC